MSEIAEFFAAMKKYVPDDARIMFSQFRCDPEDNEQGKWTAKILNNPDALDEGANVYFCVSAMKKTEKAGWKRRKDNFAGGILLMIDDIGTGPGSKFPMSQIEALPPTALIETSPNNHQAVYMFDTLITDLGAFDALINAFVKVKFLDKDTGMKGVVRVFRPPVGVNSKSKYKVDGKPFRVAMKEWRPDARYSYEQICQAFGLSPTRTAVITRNIFPQDARMRVDVFNIVYNTMKQSGMVKGQDDRDHDWVHITCPWVDGHTGGVDNGAGVTVPSEANNFYGGFKCWHGSCADRTWGDLLDYMSPIYESICEEANIKGAQS